MKRLESLRKVSQLLLENTLMRHDLSLKIRQKNNKALFSSRKIPQKLLAVKSTFQVEEFIKPSIL